MSGSTYRPTYVPTRHPSCRSGKCASVLQVKLRDESLRQVPHHHTTPRRRRNLSAGRLHMIKPHTINGQKTPRVTPPPLNAKEVLGAQMDSFRAIEAT